MDRPGKGVSRGQCRAHQGQDGSRGAERTSAWATIRECGKSNNRIEARGYIENTGNVDLNYVKVKVIWMNKFGLVLEANEMYALNNEVLAPGERKNFTDVTERSSVTQCNVEPLDFW